MLDYNRLNTRRQVRGRGTEQQGDTTNHTNMFHLGTRMPSMGPNDLDQWDKVTPLHERGRSVLMEIPQQTYAKDEFPYNSFHPGVGSQYVYHTPPYALYTEITIEKLQSAGPFRYSS